MASDYEAQRLELIARNRARLEQLGLADAADKFASTTAKPKNKPKPKQPKKPSQAPTRHSMRQSGEAPAELNDEEQQLAAMYVDGVCPKCGRAFEKGIKQHFDKCTGRPRRGRATAEADPGEDVAGDDDEEEQEEEEQDMQKLPEVDHEKLAGKLKALELSGLVDFSSEKAEFVVLGSTGSKYHVVLADDKPSCQCMDFRIRRRECKHIKLVLQQLDISSSPADWHQAVDKQLAVAAASEGKGGDADAAGGAGVTDARIADGAEAVAEPPTTQGSGTRKGRKPSASKASKRPKPAEPDASKGGNKNLRTAGASADSPTKPGTRRLPDRLK